MLPPKAIIIAWFGQLALGLMGLRWPEILIEIFGMDWAMNMTRNSYLSSHWSLQLDNVSHGLDPLRQTFQWNLLCAFTFSVLSSVHIQPLLSMTTLTYDYKLKQQANKDFYNISPLTYLTVYISHLPYSCMHEIRPINIKEKKIWIIYCTLLQMQFLYKWKSLIFMHFTGCYYNSIKIIYIIYW